MCSGTVPSLSLISKWLTSEEFYTIINWLSLFMIFSSLALVLLHLYLYGWNLYTWRQTRINYPFIFEFKPGTELGYRQVLCVASGFTSLLLAAMNSHLYISTKRAPRFKVSEIIPLAAVLVCVLSGNIKSPQIAYSLLVFWTLNEIFVHRFTFYASLLNLAGYLCWCCADICYSYFCTCQLTV